MNSKVSLGDNGLGDTDVSMQFHQLDRMCHSGGEADSAGAVPLSVQGAGYGMKY